MNPQTPPEGAPLTGSPLPDPPLPEPPFSARLLADYDVGALPAELTAHIAARLPDDPDGQRILAALAATRAELAAAPVEQTPIPAAVAERLRNLVRTDGNISP